MKVLAKESVSMRDSEGSMHVMVRGKQYDIPAEVAYGVGPAVEILEVSQPAPANVPQTKDIPEPPRHKMVESAPRSKGSKKK